MTTKQAAFHLRVSEDKLRVLLDCEVTAGNLDDLSAQIREDLDCLKLAQAPTRNDVAKRLRSALENT